ncbi:hypothetical protein DT065_03290 [Salicibibacter kimchii]|uniref:Uncharacterized protein n=1 Tax=Salicibibacter kimchii TaxID=2099786 RepID=A0A345BW06_9BACI|nr:hypothetical protein DT065_03290 [Salicibibacter kimchii]
MGYQITRPMQNNRRAKGGGGQCNPYALIRKSKQTRHRHEKGRKATNVSKKGRHWHEIGAKTYLEVEASLASA